MHPVYSLYAMEASSLQIKFTSKIKTYCIIVCTIYIELVHKEGNEISFYIRLAAKSTLKKPCKSIFREIFAFKKIL